MAKRGPDEAISPDTPLPADIIAAIWWHQAQEDRLREMAAEIREVLRVLDKLCEMRHKESHQLGFYLYERSQSPGATR